MIYNALPPKDGLYDPQFEHDACGVGFVAHLKGAKSHSIVEQGIQILKNLVHRGACGCDPETGDGAGILIQLPHEFLAREMGGNLPVPGQYGVGMVFLPRDHTERARCEKTLEDAVLSEGQKLIGWRDVPVDNSAVGYVARESEPVIRQIFIARNDTALSGNTESEDAFERKLYVIRKVAENNVLKLGIKEEAFFYVCSLSCRTIVYKGLLLAHQIANFYKDLDDPAVTTALALVHQRFSTNTFPTWPLAHPYRMLAHNGEINTLRGNRNWMRAREAHLSSELFGSDVKKLMPLVTETGSDSATIDNALELLYLGGRSLAHSMMMLVPEAWGGNSNLDEDRRAFYEYHACLMEPWDGPAALAFSDGQVIGALLDRNGLRPARYLVTKDDLVVMASETGVLDIPAENIREKWRLQPGKIFMADLKEGRIIEDEELKERLIHQKPYRLWLQDNKIDLGDLPDPQKPVILDHDTVLKRQQAFGYTLEDLKILLAPMAVVGEQPLGSMGNDIPLAVLSQRSQLLYNYFKQLFAQVTNPPIDAIREELVMSLSDYIGKDGNLLDETAQHCHQLKIESPILTNVELEKLRQIHTSDFHSRTLSMLFDVQAGEEGMRKAIERINEEATQAVKEGVSILILSDRGVDQSRAPIPALLATSAVHHHLIREGSRTAVGLVVESAEPREVMHFCLLIGYGASAINPYLAFETLDDLVMQKVMPADLTADEAQKHFIKAINKGLLKTMAKMGISTLQSYRGAQIFEAIGLHEEIIDRYFTNTPSRISGVKLDVIAREAMERHAFAYPVRETPESLDLEIGGQYKWRRGGEVHQINPDTVAALQYAVRSGSYLRFKEYSAIVNKQSEDLATLRGLFRFRKGVPIPLDEVESAHEIVKRFATGAMSLGSISREAHETLAIAMNRLGGRSNTGEGGEDPCRYEPDVNGDIRRSSIKQVASGRFGVTAHYLVNSDELQIKMAQGAKPGEGGELPGRKVSKYIAMVRHTTPGVTLISPPPHHDIYSIEDLAQLIFDLKNSNIHARISVKLVSEVGVGTVAAGVAKAHADQVLISGYDGGTGASPLSSIKHAGIPWELGLAETQQVLVKNDLRGRIRVQTDGQLKTGRDVAIAALLGAEEFGFSTAPLISMGCIMMRVCHLNTCPVGIATQDETLRGRFGGKPEHVVNFFTYVAEEVREIMAELGFRTLEEMVGRTDMLEIHNAVDHWKANGLDVSALLKRPNVSETVAIHCVTKQDHGIDTQMDWDLIQACTAAIECGEKVDVCRQIKNSDRTVGTMLSAEIARKYGEEGLPEDTINLHFNGSAGQSFGAFVSRGITMTLEGDANDYLGKGLSGGKLIIYPPRVSTFEPHENILAGNTLLYGATSGEVYLRGVVGERFCVRNSGASAVVEGTGDHGCEYMTGGVVVVLGKTGRNFAAGMSGGVAYVWDVDGQFDSRLNHGHGSILSGPITDPEDIQIVKSLIERHSQYTGSGRAQEVLSNWETSKGKFIKVISKEYITMLAELALEEKNEEEAAAV